VGDEEGGLNVASIGVSPLSVEDLVVKVNVVVVDGIIEGNCDHLWDSVTSIVARAKVSRNLRTIFGAEAVGQLADVLVAEWSPVRIVFNIACIFVRTIVTVLVAITEKTLVDADGVAARKLSNLTERLVCAEQRLNFPFLGQLVTVLHSPLPITRLLLQVKRQARGASDGLQAPCSALDDISAGVFPRLQSKQLAGALSSAEFLLLSQLLITLAKNS
jgi:hypothetical protein